MTAHPFAESGSARSGDLDIFGMIRWRVLASIAATVGWLSLTLVFLAFGTHGFTLFQDIVVVVVSLLVLGALLLGAWISFGLGFVGRWDD